MKGDVFEKFIFKGTLLKQLYQDKTGVKNMFENMFITDNLGKNNKDKAREHKVNMQNSFENFFNPKKKK